MTISASVWSAQHPNAGQNIQHNRLLNSTFNELGYKTAPICHWKIKANVIKNYSRKNWVNLTKKINALHKCSRSLLQKCNNFHSIWRLIYLQKLFGTSCKTWRDKKIILLSLLKKDTQKTRQVCNLFQEPVEQPFSVMNKTQQD